MDNCYTDITGKYYGLKLDGVPHGKGVKCYKSGIICTGTWQHGRITGEVTLETNNIILHVEFNKGKLFRMLRIPNSESKPREPVCMIIPYNIICKEENNKFYEYIDSQCPQYKYYSFLVEGTLFADGKIFFRKDRPHFRRSRNQRYTYTGEIERDYAHGYGEYKTNTYKKRGYYNKGEEQGDFLELRANGNFFKKTFKNGVLHGIVKRMNVDPADIETVLIKPNFKSRKYYIASKYENGRVIGNSEVFKYGKLMGRFYISNQILEKEFSVTELYKSFKNAKKTQDNGSIRGELECYLDERDENNLISPNSNGICLIQLENKISIGRATPLQEIFPYSKQKTWIEFENSFRTDEICNSIENTSGKYYGEVIGDTIKGKGVMRFANGEIYKGMWENNKFNGVGRYFYQDGSVFHGTFRDNMRDGSGIMIGKACTYKGQWKNDMMNGKGQLIFKDMSIEAIWQNNQIAGLAKVVKNSETFLLTI